MRLPVALALLVSVFSLRVGAVTQIVAIGDSLTDDCNHGAKQVVDAALDSTAVSTARLHTCTAGTFRNSLLVCAFGVEHVAAM